MVPIVVDVLLSPLKIETVLELDIPDSMVVVVGELVSWLVDGMMRVVICGCGHERGEQSQSSDAVEQSYCVLSVHVMCNGQGAHQAVGIVGR